MPRWYATDLFTPVKNDGLRIANSRSTPAASLAPPTSCPTSIPIRIRANKRLELQIEDILFRPPGRPSRKPLVRYKSFRYQAKSWTEPRPIIAKVEHHQGELFPRVGFIVTNMTLPSRSVVRFYNKRGTDEQWIKEGKQATHWTLAVVSSVSGERSAAATERAGLQPGQPLAPSQPAAADQELVADESAAPAREDGRTARQACTLLLVALGRGTSAPAAVRRHAAGSGRCRSRPGNGRPLTVGI